MLGLSLVAQAKDVKIGIPLIKREEIQRIAEANHFNDMETALLESGILKEAKLREYYIVVPNRLKEETTLSLSEKDEYIFNILQNLDKKRTIITLKKFQEMVASTQDFSPAISNLGHKKISERFQKREP